MNCEPWQRGAIELADAIAAGELTATEVIESHIERIGSVNPSVNAITETLETTALQAARAIDRR